VLFTPYLGLVLLPDVAKHGVPAGRQHDDPTGLRRSRIYCALGRVIEFALAWRKSVVAVTVLMFVAAVAGFGLVQQQFFPTSSRTELFFELRLPEGTAIGVTDASAKKAESMLVGDPDIVTYTTYVGQGAPRFWLGLNPVVPNPNFAQIVIVTKDLEARERVKARLEQALAQGALTEARARVDRFSFGPPVGFPVQFRVVGPDPLKVRGIADRCAR
jgi:multidrug efflux pump